MSGKENEGDAIADMEKLAKKRAPRTPPVVRYTPSGKRVSTTQYRKRRSGAEAAEVYRLARTGQAIKNKNRAPKRVPVGRAYRPAINADFRHQKAIILARYRKRVYEAKYDIQQERAATLANVRVGAITTLQGDRFLASKERQYRRELQRAEQEKERALVAIGATRHGR